MNHAFLPSVINSTECGRCHKDEKSHGSEASCDCCDFIGTVELVYGNMLMCPSCIEREKKTSEENMSPENQAKRVSEMNAQLQKSREIDSAIQTRGDIFNAETLSIVELEKLINENDSISNKPYTLAIELTERIKHLQEVSFGHKEALVTIHNQQMAVQLYLNTLSNKLRIEEREKIKLSDISYNPNPVKVSKPKTIKTAKVKFSKEHIAELRQYAGQLGVTEYTLQNIVISKNMTVKQAAEYLMELKAQFATKTMEADS